MISLSDCNVKARKQHRCDLCGEAIAIGETHRHWTGKDGGEFMSSRQHLECLAVTVADRWDAIDWESGWDEVDFRARRDEIRAKAQGVAK